MQIAMFTPWQVRCGIASYANDLVGALDALDDTHVRVIPFDRQAHPRRDYAAWGSQMNDGDVAHIQHEYTFFGYLLPWRNHYEVLRSQVRKPLVITRHVSFDGPLMLPGHGPSHWVRQAKWSAYNRWLGPYATYLNKGVFDVAQQIIVLSHRLKDHLVVRGVRDDKIHVIPPGVPKVPPAQGGQEVRTRIGWENPRRKVIGTFGYITPAKGHLIALEALASLPEEYVLLVGGGLRREADRPALDAINRRIDQLRLRPRVYITGFIEEADMPAHIGACDVLAYPATHVDSSYSVMVGLAYHSAPVVVSDAYGHRELYDRHAGVAAFRSGDALDLARVIREVVGQPSLRDQLITEAIQYARDYSWRDIARQTREVYILSVERMNADALHVR